jgi:hypothetical protein
MLKFWQFGLATVLLLIASGVRADDPPALELPAGVREYLAKTYFDNCDPADPRIDKSVEVLGLPATILEHIRKNEWEAGQIENFAANKLHLIVTTPAGKTRSIIFRDGKRRNDRELSPARERIMRRLYSDAAFSAPEAEELKKARFAVIEPGKALEAAIARLDDKHALDADTLERARKNLAAAANEGIEIAIALDALGRTGQALENCWAGVWLLSRLDVMNFDREEGEGTIADLQSMRARIFYENVFYATRARHEYPWGAKCGDHDFLQQVLSPRGTGEPLQRWRRHFFEALEPELRELKDADTAIEMARGATYDFFQYEGETTWEDFGMLTALAVHEGRCEDCSNVENCMLRAAGFPAAQAFTPWWGHQDGNHAWTVIPSIDGSRNGNGEGAIKVYVKTWDKLEDVTAVNAAVLELAVELDEGVKGEKAALHVWNHDEWRVVARSVIGGREVTFKDVGKGRNVVLLVRAENSVDRLFSLAGGVIEELSINAGAETFDMLLPLETDLGVVVPDEPCKLWVCSIAGWIEVDSTRKAEGLSFKCDVGRLYRLECKGVNSRPFRVKADKTLQRY